MKVKFVEDWANSPYRKGDVAEFTDAFLSVNQMFTRGLCVPFTDGDEGEAKAAEAPIKKVVEEPAKSKDGEETPPETSKRKPGRPRKTDAANKPK